VTVLDAPPVTAVGKLYKLALRAVTTRFAPPEWPSTATITHVAFCKLHHRGPHRPRADDPSSPDGLATALTGRPASQARQARSRSTWPVNKHHNPFGIKAFCS
jgi:hypothetical protein